MQLTFIRTGDINAMWLRDSANQLQSYKPLLRDDPSPDSLASLFRGTINLQARYIRASPHCNAFQPPPESGLEPEYNSWSKTDFVVPRYNKSVVFECKYELDSIAAFLQLSHDYFTQTGDITVFQRPGWSDAVDVIMNTTSDLLKGTYAADGTLIRSPFLFERQTTKASETTSNEGAGSPVRADTGLVRSFFRPSDDACVFQLFIPANMMFARYLDSCADIMKNIDAKAAGKMRGLAEVVKGGIEKYGRVEHGEFGEIYAYEVDGYGSQNLMVRR